MALLKVIHIVISLKYSNKAEWQSGYAADCNSVYIGSIPFSASNQKEWSPHIAPVSSLKQTQNTSIVPTDELHFQETKSEKSVFISNSRIVHVSASTWICFSNELVLSKKVKSKSPLSVFLGLWEQFLTKKTVFQSGRLTIEPQWLVFFG